jgi:hypothetical protein
VSDTWRVSDIDVRFAEVNWFLLCLNHLRFPGNVEYALRPVMESLTDGLHAASKRISEWAADTDPEALYMIDDECGYLEDLLGAAFVIAQRYLTNVVARVNRLAEGVKREIGNPWSLPSKRDAWLAHGPVSTISGVPFAALLDASANYFKHESEWRLPWAGNTGLAAKTIRVVTAAGASEGCSGNCRTLADVLGVIDYEDFRSLEQQLDAWAIAIEQAVREELQRLHLIT